jgi:uncharacterized protein YecT (DUF1311 family)
MNKISAALLMAILTGFTAGCGAAQGQESETSCEGLDADQASINECIYNDYDAADKALNAVYKKVKGMLQSWDDGEEADQRGAVKALTEGQRGWVAYRDGYCTAYGFQAHGGSLETGLVGRCMSDVTKARVKELQTLLDEVGGR